MCYSKQFILRKIFVGTFFIGFLISLLFIAIEPTTNQQVPINQSLNYPDVYFPLDFSTYLGGSDDDAGRRVAIATDGSCYVIGATSSSNFPTLNAYDGSYGGSDDAFVAKYASNGSLLWSTYLGGTNIENGIFGIAAFNNDSCYVIGRTSSGNFPTLNAFQSTYGGSYDAFIAKFASNGTLLWSTYFGGGAQDRGTGIAVGPNGSCYVTGETYSTTFPILNAYDSIYSGHDAFVAKFNSSGSLLWSTYLGGSGGDPGRAITVSTDGSCYVTGETYSTNFPTKSAFDSSYNGEYDAYVTKFSSSGSLVWSTYLGGNDPDQGWDITVTTDNICYVIGETSSSNFPTLNAFNSTFGGSKNAFIGKFSESGSLQWLTFLGGNGVDVGFGISVSADSGCYATGQTSSSNFPILNAYDSSYNGGYDTYITKFSSSGSLVWSTFLGGSSSEGGWDISATTNGICVVAGSTTSSNFPTLNAYDNTYDGFNQDAFVTKFTEELIAPTISSINHVPENPTINDLINITCVANDSSGICNVSLHFRVNDNSWEELVMTLDQPNTYKATMTSSFEVDDFVEYYIQAIDDSPNQNIAINNNNSQLYSFILESPEITLTTPTTNEGIIFNGLASFGFLVITALTIVYLFSSRKKNFK